MNLVVTVLGVVTPVFLLAGIGFGWVRLGFEYPLQFVSRLAMNLAVPALVFTALMQAEADLAALGQVALGAVLAHLAVALVGWALLRGLRFDLRTYLAPFLFGNTGNIGLPLALFAFGQEGLEIAVVVLAVSVLGYFTLGIRLVAGHGAGLKMLREPMVWATLAGAICLWQGWQTPEIATKTLTLLGQMAIPLMLITLGVAVGRLSPGKIGPAIGLSVVKFRVCAGLSWGIGHWLGLGPVAFGVLVLQMATPVAVTGYLLASKYEADAEAVAGLVVVSTLLAVPFLSLLLFVLI